MALRKEEFHYDPQERKQMDEVIPEQGIAQRTWKSINPEAVEKLRQLQEQILREHGGKPFESSVELLRESREERDKELGL